MDTNPYSAPSADLIGVTDDQEVIAMREEHLRHEASLRGVGIFYYVGGLISLLLFISALIVVIDALTGGPSADEPVIIFAVMGAIFLVSTIMSFVGGRKLRKLSSSAQPYVGILSGLGLLGIPLGTIINGYILYLVFSKKGSTVLSEEYKKVIEQTPDMQYRTPVYQWVIFIAVIALVVGGVYFAISNP